jgi:hypothetical protein
MTNQLSAILTSSLNNNSFIRLILSSPDDKKGELNKVTVRLVELKRTRTLTFLYTYKTKTVTKNFGIEEGVVHSEKLFGDTFTMCVIFTTEADHSFRRTKKGNLLYYSSKAKHTAGEFSLEHNLKKKRMISAENSAWLEMLGVTVRGKVTEGMSGKFRQINRFIETIDDLINSSSLKDKKEIAVYDMGSGKGYLTFADERDEDQIGRHRDRAERRSYS